jgi:hypothetical protein
VLAAVYPAVRVAAGNAFDVSAGDLAAIVALCAVAGVGVNALVCLVLPRRVTSQATALTGLVVIAWLFDVLLVADSAQAIGLRSRYALLLLSLASLALVGWLLRTRRDLRAASRFAAVMTVALTLLAFGQFLAERARTARTLGKSAFVARLTRPLPEPTIPVAGPRQDLYVLILDNYANADVLAARFGFDNAAFADTLRSLGFSSPDDTRSNYGWTPLSIGSMLAGEHLYSLEQDSVTRGAAWDALYAVIRRSRVLAGFARAGYKVFVIKSAYFFATQGSAVGESYVSRSSRSPLMRLGRVNLGRAVLHVTVPGRLLEKGHRLWMPAAVQLAPFDGIIELAPTPGPKVVIAHSLIAHNPFVFDARCRRVHEDPDAPAMYLMQIRCTNAQVLRAVRAILATDPDPVILIFGDHGSMSMGLGAGMPAEAITRAQAFERFGAFRAVRLPAGLTVPDSATPVNVMTRVVRAMLGVEIPLAADSSYWSTLDAVDHFASVDSLLRRR